jgi:hypothetical protein
MPQVWWHPEARGLMVSKFKKGEVVHVEDLGIEIMEALGQIDTEEETIRLCQLLLNLDLEYEGDGFFKVVK